MNCRGCWQRFLPLPDLSGKIEGDSVRRVCICSSREMTHETHEEAKNVH